MTYSIYKTAHAPWVKEVGIRQLVAEDLTSDEVLDVAKGEIIVMDYAPTIEIQNEQTGKAVKYPTFGPAPVLP